MLLAAATSWVREEVYTNRSCSARGGRGDKVTARRYTSQRYRWGKERGAWYLFDLEISHAVYLVFSTEKRITQTRGQSAWRAGRLCLGDGDVRIKAQSDVVLQTGIAHVHSFAPRGLGLGMVHEFCCSFSLLETRQGVFSVEEYSLLQQFRRSVQGEWRCRWVIYF